MTMIPKDDSDMDVESSNMVETLTNPRNVGVEQEKTMEQDEIEKETTNNDQASLEQLSNLVPHTEDMQDIGVVPESQFSYSIQAESIQKNDESGEIVDEGGDLKAEDRKESLQPKTRDSRFKLDPLVVEEPENKSKPGSEIDQEMESEVDMLEDKELEHGADLEHVSDQDLDMELDQKPEIEVEMQPKSEPETDMMIGPEIEPSFNGKSSNEPMEVYSPSGHFRWTIKNFSKISEKKIYSDIFYAGGHPWRILIFPKGNNQDTLSIYLDVGDSPPLGWARTAYFSLNIVDQKDDSQIMKRDCSHRFHPKERDWGFTAYMPLSEFYDSSRGLIVDDTVILEAEVNVRPEDVKYDSKKATGFVGLKNQGATCYMNSLLQTLFHLPYFRKAVYHMPTTEEDLPQNSIPLALQALFYKLQYSTTSVPTNDLTRSFGWDTYDSFMQHDVQELNRVLCEKLEVKMKGTKVEGTIEYMFEGHIMNYIQCINVDYKSTRKESFYDLQLDVKNCKDVYASFDKYVEVEMLDGENKYHAEQHGLQDAKKGVMFMDFPPVLELQLKRFEYDFMRDIMVKINDKYAFPLKLNLDKYLSLDADKSKENSYELHSVLVHSGGIHGGHYYAYIRPTLSDQWYKFDDERVTKEDPSSALDDQFGGDDDSNAMNVQSKYARFSNAYMLVYVRKSDIPSIFCQVDETDIAVHLLERMRVEQEELERRRKEQAESHLYTTIRLTRHKDLEEHIGKDNLVFDLVDHQKIKPLRVPKDMLFSEFQKGIEKELNIPLSHQRFWYWGRQPNHTFRPSILMHPEDALHPIGAIVDSQNQRGELKLYFETVSPDKVPDTNGAFVFVKFYDPEKEDIRFVGTVYLKSSKKLSEYIQEFEELVLSPTDQSQSLWVYEENDFDSKVLCRLLDDSKTVSDMKIKNGDIFIVQKAVSSDSDYRLPDVESFLRYIKFRQMVHFRDLEKQTEDSFVLELSKLSSYDEVVEVLARSLNLEDPSRIRLTAQNAYTQVPKGNPLKYRSFENLRDVLYQQQQPTNVLYYEVLDIPLPELEELKTIKVSFCNQKAEEEELLNLRIPRKSLIKDLVATIKEKVKQEKFTRPDSGVRVMEIYNGKIFKIYKEEDLVENVNDAYWTIRAEEIPQEEEEDLTSENSRLIQVINFCKDPNNYGPGAQVFPFGGPILVTLKQEDTLARLVEKIKAKKQFSAEDLEKIKIALVANANKVEYPPDEEIMWQYFPAKEFTFSDHGTYIGLEYPEPIMARRQTSRYAFEKPVKIHN